MTTNQLLAELGKAKPESRVFFSFCRCVPTEVRSWRGIYAEPALGWGPSGYSELHLTGRPAQASPQVTAGGLIVELRSSISGKIYAGWKGGDYSYTGDEPLHVDNPGDCTHTEIERVEIGEFEVILHTVFKP